MHDKKIYLTNIFVIVIIHQSFKIIKTTLIGCLANTGQYQYLKLSPQVFFDRKYSKPSSKGIISDRNSSSPAKYCFFSDPFLRICGAESCHSQSGGLILLASSTHCYYPHFDIDYEFNDTQYDVFPIKLYYNWIIDRIIYLKTNKFWLSEHSISVL